MSVVTETRPWGSFEVLTSNPEYWVKKITVNPRCQTSLQIHNMRSERWIGVEGKGEALVKNWPKTLMKGNHIIIRAGTSIHIEVGAAHRLINNTDEPLIIVEVAIREGDTLAEDDITRIEDDYGRK